MAFRSILRVARPDHGPDDAEFVLVYIASGGRNDLDLKLLASENTAVFSTSLKQSHTSKLRARSNRSTSEEWDSLLLDILRGDTADGARSAAQEGVEATAQVQGKSLTITIQKRIQGITQQLGTISLADTEEEADFFDWCGLAVQAKDNSRQEHERIKEIISEKDAQIKRLQDALTELTTLKKDNETQLIEKFALLLNQKKRKIREQKILLTGVDLDEDKKKELKASRSATQSRDAEPSRKGKRKATVKESSDDESEDGFEKMEVDEPIANGSDQDERNTEDDATASEDEEPVSLRPTRSSGASKKTAPVKKKSPVRAKTPPVTDDEPPPKRALPFTTKPPAQPLTPQDDGSETESDDEL